MTIRRFDLIVIAGVLIIAVGQISAQTIRNPKLSQKDLESAQSVTRDLGGANAELVYTTRLDAISKGSYDSLVVVYAKETKSGKDYFAVVSRDGKNYPLQYDKSGRALKSGDKFLRIGLKHEEGKSPLLRLMGAFTDPVKGEMQRNVDYQFGGSEFSMIGQSMALAAK
jgi:hypothetical protein